MTQPPLSLPSELASAHSALLAERAARIEAEAEAANAKARLTSIEALNAHLQLLIGKLERERYGPRRERTQRLIDQLELRLEELVASPAEEVTTKTQSVRAFTRKRPVGKPWPERLCRKYLVDRSWPYV